MTNQKPTWHEEAISKGIDYIVIVYEKAEGFVFCPSNLEYPFRVGGDYDGNFPTNAEGALIHYRDYLNPAYQERISWFIEFVDKLNRSEDFSLDDLNIESHNLRVIKGRWPW
ncbi:hypothetical protein [Acaryochloris marina]|uniref:hypothetical protein n=1 Tax=Acaryochloris marina TaxID=155978 RepID=UPI0021C3FAC9|nr:hypothetical protein [Acaryochloris marina]BDM83718.1 hypothetical protein AM10699_65790 [Acaryochloris marina MBIC10699]